MNDLIRNAQRFARECFAGDSSGHDWWHTERVWHMACRLADAEGADRQTVEMAALLHDVDDEKLSPETARDKRWARTFLEGEGVPEAEIGRIVHIIGQVSYRGSDSVIPDSIEGKCVQDADRLDAIGAVGIARTFAFGGSRGRPLWDPDEAPREDVNAANYRAGGCTVNHFYEKLLRLKDMMNTETARRIAEGRHRVMEDFLRTFFAEWRGEA